MRIKEILFVGLLAGLSSGFGALAMLYLLKWLSR